MYFSPTVKSCDLRPAGFTTRTETPMPLSVSSTNHASSLQIPHGVNLELSGTETEAEIGLFQHAKGFVEIGDERGAPFQHGDDLSAVVEKCNNFQGFVGPSLSANGAPWQLHSLDSLHIKHAAENKRPQVIMPQFHQFPKEQWFSEEGEKNGLEMKRFVHGGSMAFCSSSLKEIHSLSERVRRTEMNQLFAEMNALLPNPTVKRSKASTVSDIIDYIQSLQRQLAVHSSQHAGIKLPVKTSTSIIPSLKGESMSFIPETEVPSANSARSVLTPYSNSKSLNENLTVIYNGKDIFITMNCVKQANVLTSLIYVVESHNIQVIHGFVSTTDTVALHCLHAKVPNILDPEAKETLHGNLKKLMRSEFKISLKSKCRCPDGL